MEAHDEGYLACILPLPAAAAGVDARPAEVAVGTPLALLSENECDVAAVAALPEAAWQRALTQGKLMMWQAYATERKAGGGCS